MIKKMLLTNSGLIAMVGCASAPKGSHEEMSRLEKSITTFSSVSVSASTNFDEAKDIVPQLEQAVASEVKRAFPSLKVSKGNRGEAQLRIKITDYRAVGKVGRFVAGYNG